MLLDLILGGDVRALLIGVLIGIPAVVICLSFHEAAHGFAAYLLGDRTAQASGRLTLDPLAHIDPWGFVCMLLLGFGWARPVPVNISHFKNRRLGMGVTVIAVQSRMLISFRFMFSSSFLMVFCSLMINLFYLQRQKKYMENQAFPMYFPAQLLYNIFIFQTQICNLRILSLPSYTLRTE